MTDRKGNGATYIRSKEIFPKHLPEWISIKRKSLSKLLKTMTAKTSL